MTTDEIRSRYLKFFADRGHKVIPRANLVPQDDPTTLFTGSGMQPLLPYLLGAKHPEGTELVDSQPAFRAEDIDEVGDNSHTTSFEMLGNWSLGKYFKEEQIPWMFEFLTKEVGLNPEKLYVTCFIGEPKYDIPKDTEAAELWQKVFKELGIEAQIADIGSEADGYDKGMKDGQRIFYYDGSKNWWNRGKTGPETTPVGDPCGPDSEMFFDFGTPHDKKFGEHCHPNCDCGRFMEIGNNVFMAYRKETESQFVPLERPNIDHGSGLERIAAAKEGSGDIFKISLLWPIIGKLEELSGKSYKDNAKPMRIIADHLRATSWLAVDGVVPSNNTQGYVMRRFLRRAILQAHNLGLKDDFFEKIVPVVTSLYRDDFPEFAEREDEVIKVLMREESLFRKTLDRGLRVFDSVMSIKNSGDSTTITGQEAFVLFDTHGFPLELTIEEADRRGIKRAHDFDVIFKEEMAQQKERSRTAAKGEFKGGLADHSEIVTKYHTATHLMYRALRMVLGDHVIQRGSNITAERLRFDFSHPEKMTPEQIAEVEKIVNEQITRDWPMTWREEKTKDALTSGVMGAFGDRYGDEVKVYTVGDPDGEHYSREICGGPHVEHTGVLGEHGKKFKIKKEESSSSGVRRIKAVLE
jgi:alanyl-tRNA synthetase